MNVNDTTLVDAHRQKTERPTAFKPSLQHRQTNI
jgi:hypothetical protein